MARFNSADELAKQLAEAHDLVDEIAAALWPRAKKANGQTVVERLKPVAAAIRDVKTFTDSLTEITDRAIGKGPWSEGSGNGVPKRLSLIITDREIDKVRSVGWEARQAHEVADKILRLLKLTRNDHPNESIRDKLERIAKRLKDHPIACKVIANT